LFKPINGYYLPNWGLSSPMPGRMKVKGEGLTFAKYRFFKEKYLTASTNKISFLLLKLMIVDEM